MINSIIASVDPVSVPPAIVNFTQVLVNTATNKPVGDYDFNFEINCRDDMVATELSSYLTKMGTPGFGMKVKTGATGYGVEFIAGQGLPNKVNL